MQFSNKAWWRSDFRSWRIAEIAVTVSPRFLLKQAGVIILYRDQRNSSATRSIVAPISLGPSEAHGGSLTHVDNLTPQRYLRPQNQALGGKSSISQGQRCVTAYECHHHFSILISQLVRVPAGIAETQDSAISLS